MDESPPCRLFRFGVFEFKSQSGELSREGKKIGRLQGQPLQMLGMLLEQPGALVSREELRKRLWPADTFVDYDHSLNTAVSKLREVLKDTAANPRFIQTLPRRGYRFIAPVTVLERPMVTGNSGTASPESTDNAASPVGQPEKGTGFLSDTRELPPLPRSTANWLFSLLQVMYLGFYVAYLADLRQTSSLIGEVLADPTWAFVLLLLTAAAGIPFRLYLLSAVLFGYQRLSERFEKLFPAIFLLDVIWALGPFLLVHWIGNGLALAATAALLFLPFSQRSLLLMGSRSQVQNKTHTQGS